MKRSGKFYRKNEAEVMKSLGLDPTPNSGSGWIVKEDGQNENVICQLKSTDASSISVKKLDIDKLEYNAMVAKKLPVFALQFLQSGDVFLLVRPEHLQEVSEYIESGIYESYNDFLGICSSDVSCLTGEPQKTIVSSSSSARDTFNEGMREKYKKKERSAL